MEVTFRGASGGGSSGGSGSFTTRPDTLRSNDTFEGLLGLCVGPIKGPVNGMKGVRVNETPIIDTSGNENFKDFTAVFADGDPLKFPQTATLRLGSAGAPINIGVQLSNVGGNAATWVTRTVTNTGASALDLRFDVSQLYRQDKTGMFGTTASIEVQMKPVGSATWINPLGTNGNTTPAYNEDGIPAGPGSVLLSRDSYDRAIAQANDTSGSTGGAAGATTGPYLKITGKTTSVFVKELRVSVPNTGAYANKGWDVRCRLVETESLDADPNFEKRVISWESVTAVYQGNVGDHEDWRGVSWLQLYGKASDSFNGIPEVSGIYDTKIVSVPPSTVFNPDTRAYSGTIWDGSWAKAFTSDPAWIINDAISDSLSGLARLMPGAHLNKWDALELSKYCSELVDDGAGGQHPRFSLNVVVTEAQRSDDFIRYLAGACGAAVWDNGDGEWRCVIDRPQATTALFTYENIENDFNYAHTDVDTRFNDITVIFNNEEFDYREDQVKLEDPDHIAKFGRKPTKVVAVGCTNRQQAVRWAILKLRTNVNEWRQVTFTTNRQGKLLERFNWILVADQSLNQTADDLKRTSGRIIQNNGTSIVLRDTVRVEVGVAYKVNVTVPNPAYDPDTTTAPSDPTWQQPTITVSRTLTNTNEQRGDVKELFLDAAFPADLAENANIALEAVGLPSTPKVYRVVDLNFADDGEKVTVSAIEVDTAKYVAADTANYDYNMPGYGPRAPSIPAPLPPDGGMVTLQTVSQNAEGIKRVLNVDWLRPSYGLVAGYRLEQRYNEGTWETVAKLTTSLHYEVTDPADGFWEYRVYTIDEKGRESLPLTDNIAIGALPQWAPTGQLTNPAITIAASPDGATFDLTNAAGLYQLFSPSGPIVEDMTFEVIEQVGATATIDAVGHYQFTGMTADDGHVTFRAHWFDYQLDRTATISKAKAGVPGEPGAPGQDGADGTVDTTPPDMPTGLAVTSSVEMDAYGAPWIKLLATWNPSVAPDLAGYTIAVQEAGGSWVEFNTGPLIAEWYTQALPGTSYGVKILAFDLVGNRSPYTAVVTHITVNDVTPPSPPTNLTADAAFQTVFLSWTSPPEADTAWIDVYEGDSADPQTAIKINTVRTAPNEQGSFGRTGLAAGTTKWYFLKAADVAGNRSDFSLGIEVTTQSVFAQDISGELEDAQIAALAAEKITGQLTDAQLAAIDAAKIAGQITGEQIADGSIGGTLFASGLTPVYIVAALPDPATTPEGRTVILTTDGKIYRLHDGAWTASVATGDLVGQIVGTQIQDGSITSSEIAANTITADNIAANTITGGQIAADAITAGHIAAGAITASEIAAGAITAGAIAAGAVTAGTIAAGAITAGDIAANTITASQIAAGAITASELAAGSVTASKIAAGQIDASKIVAASITGDRIAANTLTAANIKAATITGDKIAVGTITADRMNVASLSAISGTIGLLRTASTGARVEIESNQIRVYAANNLLRVRIGVW